MAGMGADASVVGQQGFQCYAFTAAVVARWCFC